MTIPQFLAFSIIARNDGTFRVGAPAFRPRRVAGAAGGNPSGIVPPDTAFSGFSDDIVIIVASALLVSAAVERSGIVADVFQRIVPI